MHQRPRRFAIAFAFASIIVLAGAAPASALLGGVLQPKIVNVGFTGATAPVQSILSAGGTILKVDLALKVAVVSTTSLTTFLATILLSPLVRYAQVDDGVGLGGRTNAFGSSWDGSTWDGSSWDGSSWDGSSWDGSSWDGSTWDGSSWDGSSWDGSSWDGSSWDGSSWDGSSWGATRVDPGYPLEWGLDAINAPGAWDHTIGTRNRAVCVVDTGVDSTHPDIAANYAGGKSFVSSVASAKDDAGHGTHVAGILAAVTGNGIGISGIAQARIYAAKVLKADGSGLEGDAAFGIAWCADQGANVIQMSFGTDKDKAVMRDAIAYAKAKGALLVASSGNDGCACARYPAAYADVLAVGSIGESRAKSKFSNTGAHLDFAAPGERIASLWPGAKYRTGAGTSQAAPFVAGVAALAWGADPGLTAAQVRSILQSSATNLGAAGWDSATGWGVPNAHAAVEAALA